MLKYFNTPWRDVPLVAIDTETTGVHPGYDRAVQLGIVRFERGVEVGSFVSLVNPGREIPEEATAIHGINDEMVEDAPRMGELFVRPEVRALINHAQPLAFNRAYDQALVPWFLDPWDWPWLCPLAIVRVVDRYARGSGRHKLTACCERHGIVLARAHSAEADARAAGELFFKLAPQVYKSLTLGQVIHQQAINEAEERFRFLSWLSRQPPRLETTNV